MFACGIRVASLDSALVGVPRALLRTALLALVIPALFGWHDRVAGTALRTQTAAAPTKS
jgi:hypothetical protein